MIRVLVVGEPTLGERIEILLNVARKTCVQEGSCGHACNSGQWLCVRCVGTMGDGAEDRLREVHDLVIVAIDLSGEPSSEREIIREASFKLNAV